MNLRFRHDPNNKAPLSLHDQRHVLSQEQISVSLPASDKTVYSRPADLEDGMESQDWGILYTADDVPVNPVISRTVNYIVANNPCLQ